MMKKKINIIIILLIFCSCTEQEKEQNNASNSEIISTQETTLITKELNIKNTSNEILVEWANYYKLIDSTFSLDSLLPLLLGFHS